MKMLSSQYQILNSEIHAVEFFELDPHETALGGVEIEGYFFKKRRKAMLDALWQGNPDDMESWPQDDESYSLRLLPGPNGFALRLSREEV